MTNSLEAMKEAVRRAPLTNPEGLSPEWQAYFDAVTPLHVAELVAALEQAHTEREELRYRFKLERAILEDADKRIAELEARQLSVKLPKLAITVDKDQQVDIAFESGFNAALSAFTEAILAAGGLVEGE